MPQSVSDEEEIVRFKDTTFTPGMIYHQFYGGVDFVIYAVFLEVGILYDAEQPQSTHPQSKPIDALCPREQLAGLRKEEQELAQQRGLMYTFDDRRMYPDSRSHWRFLGNESTVKLLKASPEKYPFYDRLFRALVQLKLSPAAWSAALAFKRKEKAAADVKIVSTLTLEAMEVIFTTFLKTNGFRGVFKEFKEELMDLARFLLRVDREEEGL